MPDGIPDRTSDTKSICLCQIECHNICQGIVRIYAMVIHGGDHLGNELSLPLQGWIGLVEAHISRSYREKHQILGSVMGFHFRCFLMPSVTKCEHLLN